MAIPSFDELLSQARQVAQSQESQRTGTLLAKGLSEGFTKAFLAPPAGTKQYEGYLTPEGDVVQQPYRTGQSLVETGFNKLFGRVPFQPPSGAVGITGEQGAEFQAKRILEKQKAGEAIALEEKKQTGRIALLDKKQEARKESQGQKILAATQELGRATSDYIYSKIGVEPAGKPVLTYGEADRILRGEAIDTNDFFKEIGVEVQLGKDILGVVTPEAGAGIKEKLSQRGKQKSPLIGEGQQQKIRVRRKSDGQTGTLNSNEFNPELYERR